MTTLIETVLATCTGGILGFGFSWLTGEWVERTEQRQHDRLMAAMTAMMAEKDRHLEKEWEE